MCVAVVGVSCSVLGVTITLLWSGKDEWFRDWCRKTIWERLPLVNNNDDNKGEDDVWDEQRKRSGESDGNKTQETFIMMRSDQYFSSKCISGECFSFFENASRIQRVLDYWFGQYPPKLAEKKLWMIPSQSSSWREAVDQDIYQRFAETLVELYHSCRIRMDQGSERKNSNSNTSDNENIDSPFVPLWCQEKEIYGWSGKLATIIVFDQFSRHIHRHLQNKFQNLVDDGENEVNTSKLAWPTQNECDRIAYATALDLWKSTTNTIASTVSDINQSAPWWLWGIPAAIFSLLPLRHANTLQDYEFVQECMLLMEEHLLKESQTLLSAFRKATHRRLAILLDNQRRQKCAHENVENNTDDNNIEQYDVLEHVAFPADLSTAPQHPVYGEIKNFFLEKHSDLLEPEKNRSGTVIVSLSGGVDSMVIASILSHLREFDGSHPFTVQAVHIDYANRPESKAEAAYVENFCKREAITFACRRIDEVTRGVTDRDEYERVARSIRYQFYRDQVEECENAVGIVLGHHRGDLRENVLSNANKGCGVLDLSGMTAISKNDGVRLLRPLLNVEKDAIFDYAHRYGVPYFKDTTPHWSTRGKLRNRLLPLLQEVYGEGCLNNLSGLAVQSDECRSVFHKHFIQPFLDKIKYKPLGIFFDTAPWKEQDLFFWKIVLREALHSAGLGMFSEKSIVSFLERVSATPTLREGWLQCRKDYAVYLQCDGKVFVFYPTSFPWHQNHQYDLKGKRMHVMLSPQQYNAKPTSVATVGPWNISACFVDDGEAALNEKSAINEKSPSKLKKKKAFDSMEQFVEGFIEYYLPAQGTTTTNKNIALCESSLGLNFVKFTKHNRPPCWRGIDPKIQQILPLVGIDADESREDNDDGCITGFTADGNVAINNAAQLVKITLTLSEKPGKR
jgi:tRNA(Ile)-lysidine synthetase-like protein